MKTAEIILFAITISLFVASCISLIAFGIAGRVDNPRGIPHVPFPTLLQAGVHPTADQVLVKTARPNVLTKDTEDVFNAVVSDVQARGGVVTEYSTNRNTLTAIVPSSYLDRLSQLQPNPGQRLTSDYRAWVATVPQVSVAPKPAGPLVQVKVDIDGSIYSARTIATAMEASAVAAVVGLIGIFAAAGFAGKLDY